MNVHGVDFSGAAEPGCEIWITSGSVNNGGLSVKDVRPAASEFGVAGRTPLLEGLRGPLSGAEGTVGLDFSFGLPRAVLAEAGALPENGWVEFLVWSRERFGNADAPAMQETPEVGASFGDRGRRAQAADGRRAHRELPYSNSNVIRYPRSVRARVLISG